MMEEKKILRCAVYLWIVIRDQRDALLRESDWTESSRRLTPEQKQAWIDYRDALFDLPDTQSDVQTLADIIWPKSIWTTAPSLKI